jgi:capsid assembly protease
MFLPYLAGRLLGTPLLLSRPKLDTLIAVLGERIGGPQLAVPAFDAVPKPIASRQGSIAIIPVFGTLVRRTMGLEAASGLTSYTELSQQLRAAAADTSVRGILLELDSPGGEAGGVFELANLVRQIALEKPVWALAADSAFSAAYALASAANRVMVTATGGVGSIGVIAMHVDQSARDAKEGYRFTPITAGSHKADLSPHAPAQPEALARLQTEVDRLYGLFVDHVAAMRGIHASAIRKTEADLYFADRAVHHGLADAVLGVDDTLAEFASFLTTTNRRTTTQLVLPNTTNLLNQELPMPLDSQATPTMSNDPNPNPNTDADPPNSPDTAPSGPIDPPSRSAPTSVPYDDLPKPPVNPATTQSYADAAQIAEMCALANKTERTHGFLLKGLTVAQARTALLQELAAGEEISSILPPFGASKPHTSGSSPNQASNGASTNPLLAAVAKLGKQ